jgi:hypothetical protein
LDRFSFVHGRTPYPLEAVPSPATLDSPLFKGHYPVMEDQQRKILEERAHLFPNQQSAPSQLSVYNSERLQTERASDLDMSEHVQTQRFLAEKRAEKERESSRKLRSERQWKPQR